MSARGESAEHFPQPKITSGLAIAFCAALALVCLCAGACKRERAGRLSPGQMRQVTQQLAKAASEAAPRGTVVRILRARSGSGEPDTLHVSVRGGAETANRVRQALNSVATQNLLTLDGATQNGDASVLTLRRGGLVTHKIEIEAINGPEKASAAVAGTARLAILLDDLGNDRKAAEAIFALRVPVTVSVLPYHEYSKEIAAEAKSRGCEVMLHLPMQSLANETPEREELRPGLSQPEVEEMVNRMLEAVPQADGVNNHQGSQATAN